MKKYIKFSVVVLVLLSLFSSCDDFLVADSPSVFTDKSAYASVDLATMRVQALYAKEFYPADAFLECGIFGTDIEWVNFNVSTIKGALTSYQATSSNCSVLSTMWTGWYKSIQIANQAIYNLPLSPIWKDSSTVATAKKLYGEAVTIRAISYYHLITTFGDVPFYTLPSDASNDKTFYKGKTNRDSIYEFLVEDLRKVVDYVPWSKDLGVNNRVSKGAVLGIRARIALQYAGFSLRNGTHLTQKGRYSAKYYQIADSALATIVNSGKHALVQSVDPKIGGFEKLFRDMNGYKNNMDELIFVKSFGRGVSGTSLGMLSNNKDSYYGWCTGNPFTSPAYYYSFDSIDTRRNVACPLYNYRTSVVGVQGMFNVPNWFGIAKFRREWLTPTMGGDLYLLTSQTGVDFPILRYSDILLMYAETQNEINNGPTEAAKEAFKQVRRRAFPITNWTDRVEDYVDLLGSKDAFFNALVDENAWELAGEGIRKYDLIRWNLLGTKIQQMKDDNDKLFSGVDPKYINVPDYIWYKYDTDSKTLLFLNTNYRTSQSKANQDLLKAQGWISQAWWGNAAKAVQNKAAFASAGSLQGTPNPATGLAGFDATKNNYLYPIQNDVLDNSRGVLNNDQMP